MDIQLTNLVQDPLDPRDYLFEPEPGDILFGDNPNVTLPNAVDLRNFCTPVENQLFLNSCTAAALAANVEMFDGSADRSKLFNYFTSRELLGSTTDTGSTARCALKAANQAGICREDVWPYDTSKVLVRPSMDAYADAETAKITGYYRIQTENRPEPWPYNQLAIINLVKYALARGFAVYIGARVGVKLQNLTTEIYPSTATIGNTYWGNHQFIINGYQNNCFRGRNSWGPDWGVGGDFLMEESVVTLDAIDIWVVKRFKNFTSIGPNQIMYPPKPLPADIAAFVNANLSTPQNIVSQAVWFHLTAWEVESAVGWPAGAIRQYHDTDPIGMSLDWSGFIW